MLNFPESNPDVIDQKAAIVDRVEALTLFQPTNKVIMPQYLIPKA